MNFKRRIITKTLDLPNLQRHNDNYAEIETDLTGHNNRLNTAESELIVQDKRITNHEVSQVAHAAEHITYVGPVPGVGDTKAAIDSVQQQLNTAVMAGDSGAAAAQAAIDVEGVDHRNLKARIDSDVIKLNTQLAETAGEVDILSTVKADKTEVNALATTKADRVYVDSQISAIGSATPKGAYATLTDLQAAFPSGTSGIYVVSADGNWYYWNGSAWVSGGVYQSTGIPDASLTSAKMSFPVIEGEASKNMFNKDTIVLERYVTTSGALTSNPAYSASEYIPVMPSITYTTSHLWSGACYDSNKVFISMIPAKTFTTPLNAAFVRISMKNED
ncbi:hypothetical protein HPT30_20360, partial [Paenibacillus sp. JW14]|nr:hypothetical protein [Paenibacillus agri]